MKRLNFKATSKKANFEAFTQLSKSELISIKGGYQETPPVDEAPDKPGK